MVVQVVLCGVTKERGKMKKFIPIIFVVVSVSSLASEQISANRTITAVHSYKNGASFVYSPSSGNGLGCSGSGASKHVHIDWGADENYKAMYSLALAAYMAGKEVGFGVNGCVSAFGGSIPKV